LQGVAPLTSSKKMPITAFSNSFGFGGINESGRGVDVLVKVSNQIMQRRRSIYCSSITEDGC
jgi:hypothetical protein